MFDYKNHLKKSIQILEIFCEDAEGFSSNDIKEYFTVDNFDDLVSRLDISTELLLRSFYGTLIHGEQYISESAINFIDTLQRKFEISGHIKSYPNRSPEGLTDEYGVSMNYALLCLCLLLLSEKQARMDYFNTALKLVDTIIDLFPMETSAAFQKVSLISLNLAHEKLSYDS